MRKVVWTVALVVPLVLALVPAGHTALAATYTVTNTSDSGTGSLRQAITDASNNPGDDTVVFDIPADTDPGCDAITGVCTIQPASALPTLTGGGTTIDGYTQIGASRATDTTPATLMIEIDGTNAGATASGLTINSSNNVIEGLVINRFGHHGVRIFGSGATGNTVSGNYIGTDASGTVARSNTSEGVYISNGAQTNTIGGDTPGERNVISGNGRFGVRITDSDTSGNTLSGNYIGTDASGTTGMGNGWSGVLISHGPQNNIVGGDTDGERNVISGNSRHGVELYGIGTTGNAISGNYIGTDANGTTGIGNDWSGIVVGEGAQTNTVGGAADGERNVISGNGQHGVSITGSGATGNTVSGNYIGTDAGGMTEVGNGWSGVYITESAQDNTIGGDTDGERNVISGNDQHGVWIIGSGAAGNTVSGNYIGTNANGTTALGNTSHGIYICAAAQENTVGGDADGERNVISGNGESGVRIRDSGTTGNTISGNYIGTDANGATALGNGEYGVEISNGAQNNTIGGGIPGEWNVISGNSWDGVYVGGTDTTGNIVSGNYIGTDASGTTGMGNAYYGVCVCWGAQNNTIGGDTPGERNVISGNNQYGIRITGSGTMSNTISGNYIGTTANGTNALGNAQDGVFIHNRAQNNTIGGDTGSERNVISGNDQRGVWISGSGTTGNTVSGNFIGTDASGTLDRGNALSGVYIDGDAQNNTVGPGNVIAYNDSDGVVVNGSATTGNTITRNSIFSNTLGIDLRRDANGGIAAPGITTTSPGSVTIVGTACASCSVEVFENSDTDGEGETYVGHSTASASGAFTVTVSSLTNPYLTATATDATNGTSEFSAVFTATVTGGENVYLPIVLKNH